MGILILLNGLFVAAEFAIVGAPRAAIERKAAQGNRAARMVNDILHDAKRQDRYIATAQLGITFASLGLGMYGEHYLAGQIVHLLESLGAAKWIAAHAIASVAAVGILTYFHIVVGEMVPKSLALEHAEKTVLWITPPMMWIKGLMYPLVVGVNDLGNGILRIFGIKRHATGAEYYHTSEELQYIIEESLEGGMLHAESGQVLRDLFEFGELDAGEVMVPRVKIQGIPLHATHQELVQIFRTSRHTRYPVYEGDLDHIVGYVHVKDLMRLILKNKSIKAEDLRPVPFLPETSELDTILAVMHRERTQMVIVMDEHGGTAGLVTIEDLFEEVIGEIDEDASDQPNTYLDNEGTLHVLGTTRLEEVGEALNIALEHDEVDTVSGLVLMLLDRPPVVGDSVTYRNTQFEVKAVEGHGVQECVVTLLEMPEEEETE